MKYTIEGFNQKKAVELDLCVADLIILRWFVDFSGTDKMVKQIIDGKEFYWIKYEGLLEDLPILSITKDTLYRRLKGLVEKGILEHITVTEGGKYSFYRLGKNYLSLISDNDSTLSEKNPIPYGKKSDTLSEKNPGQNTNLLKNTHPQEKRKALSTKEGASPKKSYKTIFDAPENTDVKDALVKYIKAMRGMNYTPRVTTVEQWAEFLRKESRGNPVIAERIVDQSIKKKWKSLYTLKTAGNDGVISVPSDPKNDARDENGNAIVF